MLSEKEIQQIEKDIKSRQASIEAGKKIIDNHIIKGLSKIHTSILKRQYYETKN